MAATPLRPVGIFPPGLPNLPHHALRDPADLHAALQRSAPIRYCHSLVPDGAFLHELGFADIGGVVLVSQSGSTTDFLVEHTPDLHLLALFDGKIALETAGGELTLTRHGVALLPAGLRSSRGTHSLASITLSAAQVAAAANAIGGRPRTRGNVYAPRDHFPVLTLPPSRTEAGAIQSLLRTIDACAAIGPAVATHLGLDDVILRSAAVLLHPELAGEEPTDLLRYRDQDGRSSFDALIDYIRANLDKPLRLSDLEAHSHYSRRALQYAFRERLNSSPKRWIREQRLSLAMEELRRGGQQLPIRAVALRCGYLHFGQFSRDFKARFGLSPSQFRRL